MTDVRLHHILVLIGWLGVICHAADVVIAPENGIEKPPEGAVTPPPAVPDGILMGMPDPSCDDGVVCISLLVITILCLVPRMTVTSLSAPKDTCCKTHPLFINPPVFPFERMRKRTSCAHDNN